MWILQNFSDIFFPEHLLAITLVRKFKGSSWESIRSLWEVDFSYYLDEILFRSFH